MEMASESEEGKKVVLRSSDKEFIINELVAMESQAIRHMIEDGCDDSTIPLPNVVGSVLSRVIDYCKIHVEARSPDGDVTKEAQDQLKAFDAEFVKVDQATPFEFVLAANYLNIKGLLDLTCNAVADMIKDMTPEEVRKTFHIDNDFTEEEDRQRLGRRISGPSTEEPARAGRHGNRNW